MKRNDTLFSSNIRLRTCISKLSLFHSCSKRKKIHPTKSPLVVSVLGILHSGKSTLLAVMQGKIPDCKRTLGVKPVIIEHNESTTVKFIDIGGNKQMQNIWHHQYHASHAIIYLIDSSASDEKHNESISVAKDVLGHRFIQGKPVLVICNKMNGPGYRNPQDIAVDINARNLKESKVKIVEACVHPSYAGRDGTPDPAIKISMEWLVGTIIGDFQAINDRVVHDGNLIEEQRKQNRVSRVQ